MLLKDYTHLAISSVVRNRFRSILTSLGIAIGIAAVVLLTSIGEGINKFVLSEFTQFGTTLIGINPGRTTTHGMAIGVFGSVRPLTIDDAQALKKVPYARTVVAAVQGNAEIESHRKRRRTTVYGVGSTFPEAFSLSVASGRFLPDDDPVSARAFAVLGSKLRKELFGDASPLGKRVRVGGHRYRIIGTMESKGQVLGVDLDDAIYIPVARALELFNREGVMEIDLVYSEQAPVDEVVAGIKRILIARHGSEDFTITTQEQMMDVLGSVLNILTFAVGAIGGISLLVGGVGILTIMTISVNERVSEIGLFTALGATRLQILGLFLGESILLAMVGGLVGLAVGFGGAQLLHWLLPALPTHTPMLFVVLAECLAILIGLLAGVLPARRASRMDPIEALRTE